MKVGDEFQVVLNGTGEPVWGKVVDRPLTAAGRPGSKIVFVTRRFRRGRWSTKRQEMSLRKLKEATVSA